jgi:hypothetical protein
VSFNNLINKRNITILALIVILLILGTGCAYNYLEINRLIEALEASKCEQAKLLEKLEQAELLKKLEQAELLEMLEQAEVLRMLEQAELLKMLEEKETSFWSVWSWSDLLVWVVVAVQILTRS